MTRNVFMAFLLCLGLSLAASATNLMPDFATVPSGWVTDRYEPHSFTNVGTYQGRTDVLGIEINSAEGFLARPGGYQSTFYNTQGRQYALTGGAGSSLAADLYIPGVWADSATYGNFRTDMWGVMTDGALVDPAVTAYPIIGFTNYGGAARYRVWDADTADGWVDLSTPVSYDAWTSFIIDFTGVSFEYRIDGFLVYTDTTINGSTGFQAAIMQAYNFYGDPTLAGSNPVDYTAHWSNPVPEPATLFLLGSGLLIMARRRKIS
jgi:hypothetical protein